MLESHELAGGSSTPIAERIDDVVEKSHRERDDEYKYVVKNLSNKYRVIVCNQGKQFILQYRMGINNWTGKKYTPNLPYMVDIVNEVVGIELKYISKGLGGSIERL